MIEFLKRITVEKEKLHITSGINYLICIGGGMVDAQG